jgi:hypothetical protein
MVKNKYLLLVLLLVGFGALCQSPSIKIAKLKYSGGGDWYANRTALPNLIEFCNKELNANIHDEEDVVEVGSTEIFQYPFLYMTGHGNVLFTDAEAKNLRNYLISGGFLHIDDNYGMNNFIRREMKKVFPEHDFVEIPFNHPIYNLKYKFKSGLPKIHEHDNKPPQGFGIFYEGKLVSYFSYESDLGNGWEDQSIYNDPQSVRLSALQMGANLIEYAFTIL